MIYVFFTQHLMLLDNMTTDMTTDSNDYNIMDIYDEDEEMTPTIIDIENEEVSEGDIVLKSDYERMIEKFDESDEYEDNKKGNENESDVDDEEISKETSDEEEIIDQPLNNECFVQSNEFTHISTISLNPCFFVGCKNIVYVSCIILELTNKNIKLINNLQQFFTS